MYGFNIKDFWSLYIGSQSHQNSQPFNTQQSASYNTEPHSLFGPRSLSTLDLHGAKDIVDVYEAVSSGSTVIVVGDIQGKLTLLQPERQFSPMICKCYLEESILQVEAGVLYS